MKLGILLAASFLATSFVYTSGCSSSDSSSSSSNNDGGASNGDGGASASNGEGGSNTNSAAKVVVTYKDTSKDVDVATLTTQDYQGEQVVALTKVWEAAKLDADLAKVEFDFEGDDGFRPSSKDRCKSKIQSDQLAKGYILPATRTLIWDDSLGLPGCYSVKLVAKILVTDK